MKQIDFSQNLHALANQYPEIVDIMFELGFKDIKNPAVLNTMGRFMTIPKGGKMKNISRSEIVSMFEAKGFEVINY